MENETLYGAVLGQWKATASRRTLIQHHTVAPIGNIFRAYELGSEAKQAGVHNPERATPILSLCHVVFTD